MHIKRVKTNFDEMSDLELNLYVARLRGYDIELSVSDRGTEIVYKKDFNTIRWSLPYYIFSDEVEEKVYSIVPDVCKNLDQAIKCVDMPWMLFDKTTNITYEARVDLGKNILGLAYICARHEQAGRALITAWLSAKEYTNAQTSL